MVKGGEIGDYTSGRHASQRWLSSRIQAARDPFLGPESRPEQAGGLMEQWLAAQAAASENTL